MTEELKTGEDVLKLLTNQPAAYHVVIHPDAARALLDINTNNRVIVQRRVDELKRNLRENRWQLINNGIAVDNDGDLVDGQHRLLAVVQSNTAAEFWLHVGLDPRARQVIDTGRARRGTDALAIAGYGRGRSNVAAAVALLYRYENGPLRTTATGGGDIGHLPHDVLIEYLGGLEESRVVWAEAMSTAIARATRANRSAMLATLYLAACKDVFEAQAFADRIKLGENLHSGDPELTLRNTLARLDRSYRNDWHLCIYLKAWNARRAGKRIQVLRMTAGEAVPEVL